MSKFYVTMPFAGYVTITVEAENKAEAIEAAYGVECEVNPRDDQPEGISDVYVEEWSFLEHITQGNVCYAPCNSASAQLAKDEEDPAP